MNQGNEESLSSKTSGRLPAVDVAKGFGFFLVVLGHLVSSGSKTSVIIFSFHMPLFYMMSGYTMPEHVTRKGFLKRMLSLFFNYVFFGMIGFIVSYLVPIWRSGLTSSTLFYDVIYNTQPECIHVGQLWFLFSMIWGTLFFFGIHFICGKKEIYSIIAVLIVAALSVYTSIRSVQISIWGGIYGSLPFKLLPGMSALLFLELGYLLKKLRLTEKLGRIHWIWRLIGAGIILVGIGYAALQNIRVNIALGEYGSLPLYYLTSIGGSLGVFVLSSTFKGIPAKVVGFYGKNSLCFFAIHSMFLYAFAWVLSLIYGGNYIIMNNIGMTSSYIGTIIILILIIPMKFLYDQTGLRIIHALTRKIKLD